MKSLLPLFLTVVLITSCQKENNDDDTNPGTVQESNQLNVAYGSDASQKMDIYLPAGRSSTSTKVIILIHGGGWSSGDKADFTPFVDTLKRRLPGYAVININYRLANGSANIFPTQENDVRAAINFIYSKRNEYLISDKYVLLGTSAGAHLSLLQAYKYTTPVTIKAMVDFYGPTDMEEMYNNPASILSPPSLIANLLGGTPATNLAIYQQSSPVTFVSAQSPPTIILHGGADVVVSPNQSIALKTKLQTFGVVNQYVFYAAENHGWIGANLTDSFDKIAVFLATNVN